MSADFLAGGGEVGALMRDKDWSATALGPAQAWPQSLRTAVSILLNSRYPMFVFWGPQLVKIYNDGYRPITGDKHPWALGRPGTEVWPEIWQAIGPMVERVVRHGEATWSDDLQLFMHRRGFPEEVFFTFSYSPIRDESGGVGGMFCACTETTVKVQGERRLKLLRDLAAAGAQARTVADACALSAGVLAGNPADIPFALVYLFEELGPRLAGAAGVQPGDDPGGWPLERKAHVASLEGLFRAVPAGPWPEPPGSAMVLPLMDRAQERPSGALVLGISSRIPFDESYRGFFDLVAGQLAASISNARASEEERRRAESLAELDRAKTAFFSNVSHEFRTPLTLMLGPVEDSLNDREAPLPAAQRERLELAQRSALRLQKLVNTLLDFSRIEAGRAQASYAPTDLAALTADIASSFRSAIEKAGLKLAVDCPRLPQPAYVDRDMWEKIVLNLLSNAFKFTFEGEIEVALRAIGTSIELTVRDTGTGIPGEELPRMFERFHRVAGARGRTHEGTGIGLALVQELVKLHGGSISVASRVSAGTTFTVRMPAGKAHLPAERIAGGQTPGSPALSAQAYLEEALGWLPDAPSLSRAPQLDLPAPWPGEQAAARARILWADDNADMREYVRRLLGTRYEVEVVADGEAALAAARRRRPDLVLADVMMPKLDGLGLVRALRADPHTRGLPIILLSARAGEEARIEGLDAGADAYLYKPFSARELLARVSARLDLARLQAQLDEERGALAAIFEQAPVPIAVLRGPGLVFEMANPAYIEVVGGRAVLGKPLLEALPEAKGQGFDDLLHRVIRTRTAHIGRETLVKLERNGRVEDRYFTFIYAPLRTAGGEVDSAIAIVNEVTERRLAEEALRASEAQLEVELADARLLHELSAQLIQEDHATAIYERIIDAAVAIMRSDHASLQVLDPERGSAGELRLLAHRGFDARAASFWEWVRLDSESACGAALRSGTRIVVPDVTQCSFMAGSEDLGICLGTGIRAVQTTPLLARSGRLVGMISTHWRAPHQPSERDLRLLDILARQAADLLERKAAEQALREADRRKDEFLAMLSHELRNPLAPIRNAVTLLKEADDDAEVRGLARGILDRQVGHMVRLVDDLLDISRISRGSIGLRMEPVELVAVIDSALETSRPLIEEGGHRLEVQVPAARITLLADPVRLAQVIANLLNNAAKYTPRGGAIELAVRPGPGTVALSVKDNGIGIAPEWLPRVFEMFSQGQATRHRMPGGLGIGLGLARQLVELHGGSIEARSAGPGLGSEFTVRVPVLASGRARVVPPPVQPEAAARRRILVVDDNVDAAESLGLVLAQMGHTVQVAYDGQGALLAAQRSPPEILLADLDLPDLDGFALAARLREDRRFDAVALIAVTGYGQDVDRRRARQAGFDEHLVKPVDPGLLRTALELIDAKTL